MQFDEKTIKRFWSHVDKSGTHGSWNETPCWIWTAYCSKRGYGKFGYFDKVLGAHRVAYEITYGTIQPKAEVCHHCDNPSCVQPLHLFVGTHSDNMQDCANKGRNNLQRHPETRQGEKHPLAKLTERQVIEIRQSHGISQDKLAEKYGVCRWMIRRILSRLAWKHI